MTACKAQAAAATAGKAEVAAAQALAAHRLVYTLSFFPYLFAFLKLKAMCHKFHHILRSIFTPEPTVHKGRLVCRLAGENGWVVTEEQGVRAKE